MNSRFTVTTPASDLSLLTIAELRAAAGVADSSRDVELTLLGLRVSASIARQCGIASDGVNPPTLLRETCSEVFRPGADAASLILSRRPVTSVASVAFDDDAPEDAEDYEVDPATGILTRLCDNYPIKWPRCKISVSFVAGYATAPDDLKLAASKLATATFAETARDPNLKREDIPGVREVEFWVAPSDDPLLSQEISDLLAPYVQRWI